MSDQTLRPDTNVDDVSSAIAREDQAVIDLATAAAGPHELAEGKTFAVAVPAGGSVRIVDRDLDEYRARPRRKRGGFVVHDADSFIGYLKKHGVTETEVWADVRTQRVVAVVNAHDGLADADSTAVDADEHAGWSDHRLELILHKTPAWLAWERYDRKWLDQLGFAEHVEERSVDVVEPAAAELLEVAQTFTAKRNVNFESSQRLSTGVVTLEYRESDEVKAGKKGQLQFPEQIKLGLVPFEGGARFGVTARLRYRIVDGVLKIGYVLDRPEDVLRTAFLDDVTRIADAGLAPVFRGVSA